MIPAFFSSARMILLECHESPAPRPCGDTLHVYQGIWSVTEGMCIVGNPNGYRVCTWRGGYDRACEEKGEKGNDCGCVLFCCVSGRIGSIRIAQTWRPDLGWQARRAVATTCGWTSANACRTAPCPPTVLLVATTTLNAFIIAKRFSSPLLHLHLRWSELLFNLFIRFFKVSRSRVVLLWLAFQEKFGGETLQLTLSKTWKVFDLPSSSLYSDLLPRIYSLNATKFFSSSPSLYIYVPAFRFVVGFLKRSLFRWTNRFLSKCLVVVFWCTRSVFLLLGLLLWNRAVTKPEF